MKKNAMLKIAAVLLVAVLLTTCAISSTFAKYVSDGMDYSETARVAKWGVEFKTTTTTSSLLDYDDPNVKSSNEDKVVAPGTEGSFTLDLSVQGIPEVAFEILLDSDKEESGIQKNYIAVDENLKPQLSWSYSVDGGNFTDVGADYNQINTAIATAAERTFTIGQDTNYTKTIEIKWVWNFYTSDAEDGDDSTLGNNAALTEPVNQWINFNAFGQIVQID